MQVAYFLGEDCPNVPVALSYLGQYPDSPALTRTWQVKTLMLELPF